MKSIEKFYDMPIGNYCGVMMREKLAKKVASLLYKQNQELKELLASELSQLEVSHWTLAYPNNKQTTVNYFTKSSDNEKIDRIMLLNKLSNMRLIKDGVFIASDSEDAEMKFMEHFEKISQVGEIISEEETQ